MSEVRIAVGSDCSWGLVCSAVRLLGAAAAQDMAFSILMELPHGWLSPLRESLPHGQAVSPVVATFAERPGGDVSPDADAILSDASGAPAHAADPAGFATRVLTSAGLARLDDLLLHCEQHRAAQALRDIHRGRRAFIIGNGLSLRPHECDGVSR
jgi:hypothetical protein